MSTRWITNGPKAFTTFGANGKAYPLQLAGNCFKNSATATTQVAQNGAIVSGGANALQGGINNSCFGTASNPGDQINTHEFTQGLINPLTRGSIYSRVSYDLAPDTEIYATL